MATLALSAVGSALGAAVLPSGLSFLGASLTGAALGQQAGALVGSQIDQALFGSAGRQRALDGPRLSDLRVTSSSEGSAIPRLYGTARLGGQLIWATALEEEAVSRQAGGGGKGARSAAATGTDYAYFANVAIAIAEGEITRIGRVWADNREIDLSAYTTRLYRGTATQSPDPLILAKQGGHAPAYRGVAYLVFEHLPLADFGNRIPQFSFEVSRAVDDFEQHVRAVAVIPGSGEFAYAPTPINRTLTRVSSVSENVHTRLGGTDWSASMDQLAATLPNAHSVSLVVSWFGDDLRAGSCQLAPRVDAADRVTTPLTWSVAGLDRCAARVVSSHADRPAYGGTPSDQTVVAAIRDLTARGHSVVFSPFVLMDIPAANTKPDPYSAAASQPSYPWRGRITVTPAAGRPSTADQTSAAASQLAVFVGTAVPSHFSLQGDAVHYSGPTEWSFRRFILHYANLCKAAGGVDAFVLCSELRGLTTARSSASSFPFVAALVQLAADVRAILGPATRILYAADWSEYFGHQPSDGSGDVYFHLDPLWSSPDIDAIGIDAYWPLADWRDGDSHLDRALAASPHDLAYLKHNLTAGEGYDWYYASAADRDDQHRTPITDGAGKPWLFRFKDIRSWWSNPHYNRPGGIESSTPTAWVPQSKPFWFTEIGCPAVDKGANQPNVFVDAKSIESHLPHYSSGTRDDLAQRRLLLAFIEAYDPAHPGYVPDLNPVSTVTGQRMVDIDRTHIYAWDARPYPAFPNHAEIWRDSTNWPLGHWINGRIAAAPLASLVTQLLRDYAFTAFDAASLTGTAVGFAIDRIMSAREALQPLELAFFFDVMESDGRLRFQPRGHARTNLVIDAAAMVEAKPGADLLRIVRAQETDLPQASKIGFIAASDDYPQAIAEARRIAGASGRIASASLGLILDPAEAHAIAESWLFETWSARLRATFTLPPSLLALEPGDVVTIATAARNYPMRITETGDHIARDVEARAFDNGVYAAAPALEREQPGLRPDPVGQPHVTVLDIPPADGTDTSPGFIAVAQQPWPGPIAVFSSPEITGYQLATIVTRAATTGITRSALQAHAAARLDHASILDVELDRGALQSVSDLALFDGANTAAIELAPDIWEIIQFRAADIIAPRTYRLSQLLRGRRGTDALIAPSAPIGARFVMLDDAVTSLDAATGDFSRTLNWKVGPARKSIDDPDYLTLTQRLTSQGQKPYAPVHLRAARNATGDITLSWIRQSRVGGDSWDSTDVALGETDQQYAIDILADPSPSAVVLRTLTTTVPAAIYTAAAQLADFGVLQPLITVRVVQLSPVFGRGHARTATL